VGRAKVRSIDKADTREAIVKSKLWLGALAVLMLAGAPAEVWSQTEPKTVVKVGVTGRPDQSGLELAFRRGYFAEQGLDVQFVPGGSSAQDFTAGLATNQLQVVAGSPSAGLMNALNRGIDLRIVADWARVGPDDNAIALVVRSDLLDSGAVKTPADLKGRTIAAGTSMGAYNEMLLEKILKLGNLTRNDINMQTMGFADGLAAMANKRVDAALVIEPLVWSAGQRGIGRVLVSPGKIDVGAQVAVVLYSPEFAKNKEAATRYMVGYLKGVRDYHDAFVLKKNIEAAVDIMVEHLALKDRRTWIEGPPHRTDLNGRINVAHIKEQAAFYKATGSVSGPVPDIDKYVDMSFAEEAVKRLGSRTE
jgi:NitT/TauT family transport system substrate-binding protein